MKKRLLAGLLAAAMLTGLGSVVFAADIGGNTPTFSAEIATTGYEGKLFGKSPSDLIENDTLKRFTDEWSFSDNKDECKGYFVPIAVTIGGITKEEAVDYSVKAESDNLELDEMYYFNDLNVFEEDGNTIMLHAYRVVDEKGEWQLKKAINSIKGTDLTLTLYKGDTAQSEPVTVEFYDLKLDGLDDVVTVDIEIGAYDENLTEGRIYGKKVSEFFNETTHKAILVEEPWTVFNDTPGKNTGYFVPLKVTIGGLLPDLDYELTYHPALEDDPDREYERIPISGKTNKNMTIIVRIADKDGERLFMGDTVILDLVVGCCGNRVASSLEPPLLNTLPSEDNNDNTVTSVEIAFPANDTVKQGATEVVFEAIAKNAEGTPVEPQPTFTWEVAAKTGEKKEGTAFVNGKLNVAEDETENLVLLITAKAGDVTSITPLEITVVKKDEQGDDDPDKSGTDKPGIDNPGTTTPTTPTTPSRPGSSSSGGGSSSGSGSSVASPAQTATVTETSAVTKTTSAVTQAIAQAEKADADTATATVKVQNAKSISAKVLDSMVQAAEKAAAKKGTDVTLVLHADVVKNGKVESRLYIDPTKATLKGELKLGVTLGDQKVETKFDKYFENKIAVVKFDQVGTFGMSIKAAVKADLKGMDTRTLYFYSYDAKTNTYVRLVNPRYKVDANGYLHFTTSQGNYVIVTDAPLVRK